MPTLRLTACHSPGGYIGSGIPGNNTPSTGYKLFHKLLESFDTPELKRVRRLA